MNLIKGFFTLVVVLCVTTTLYVLVTSEGRTNSPAPTVLIAYDVSQAQTTDQNVVAPASTAPASNPVQSGKKYNFTANDLHRQFAFSTDSPLDVLVFVHIQKTGGTTFGKNLVKNLNVRNPCRCNMELKKKTNTKLRCPCYTSDGKRQWLFSRYSTGWMCGLHADYTEWMECLRSAVPDQVEGFHRQRRYLMLTTVRDPIDRYISEYLHTNRGATWSGATLTCNGRSPTKQELPSCFNETWEGVRLPEFLQCPYNLANNRQTRMLANLSLVNCYERLADNEPLIKQQMLISAQDNLKSLAFYGLKEFPKETQYLFEHTFNVKFTQPLGLLKPKTIHDTREYFEVLKPDIQEKIRENNDLDIKLYEYAKQLFLDRYHFALSWRSKLKSNHRL